MNNTYYVYSINLYVIIIDRVDAVTSERFSQQQCSESAVISYDRVFFHKTLLFTTFHAFLHGLLYALATYFKWITNYNELLYQSYKYR